MSKSSHSILILEPSDIVYEGLVSILLNSGIHYHVIRISNLDEIHQYLEGNDILIINPQFIHQHQIQFETIISKHSLHTIAILYSLFPQAILSLCKASIHITDTPEHIIQIIEQDCNEEHNNKNTSEKELLSEREIQVLTELVKGLSNKEIADVLCISTHTVISHRKNIVQKTGIKSQASLTIYALSNSIISLDSIQ